MCEHLDECVRLMLHLHSDAFAVRGSSGKYEAPDILQFISGLEQRLTELNRKQCCPPPFMHRSRALQPDKSLEGMRRPGPDARCPPLLEGLAICPLAPAHQSGTGSRSGERTRRRRGWGTLANRCGQIVD